ncbi:hypothetical protein HYH02_001394 [Chlamydomonas schloesseri]|uniref:Uncharacterized protein n=1 Tax=Chlamydomonas schloesseri TaxID=2026947 RepID=A0A836BCF2_9CHLO|nr:hypothetical protein HYH02_001394 [Chlamydomonas schloesseri]|eukprot:KAG2454371.1 hypothetical protein HYH02_001394 [Chlamydomonas schloesseri]
MGFKVCASFFSAAEAHRLQPEVDELLKALKALAAASCSHETYGYTLGLKIISEGQEAAAPQQQQEDCLTGCYDKCIYDNPWSKDGAPYCDPQGKAYRNYCEGRCKCTEPLHPCAPPPPPPTRSPPPPQRPPRPHGPMSAAKCLCKEVTSPCRPPSPNPPPGEIGTCIQRCDNKYPNWYVWVCDKDGNAYQNWCYAACHECEYYTICQPPQAGMPSSDHSWISLTESGYSYKKWVDTSGAGVTYAQAEAKCGELGPAWEVTPYDNAGWAACKQLCSSNGAGCWLKRGRPLDCPVINAAGQLSLAPCGSSVQQRYPYATQTYHCESDCRTYTLVDINAGCMSNWAGASAYCESRGLELAPWDTDASNGALHKLCRDNRYTCWTGGRDERSGLCPLMTQEGHIVQQGCEQPVRWVCRTKQPNTSYYCQNDCRTYTLYDINAICMVDYGQARVYCERTGGELVPYGEAPAMGALHKLCRDNRYTCWTGGRDERSGLCPLMTQEGHIVQQGCEQPVRWVCRTKKPSCKAK